jgi:twitching motility protein PilT
MAKRLLPDPDLQDLIRRLNASAQEADETENDEPDSPAASRASSAGPAPRWMLPRAEPEGEEWLRSLLAGARDCHASDLLLVAGVPPTARVHGKLQPLNRKPLEPSGAGLLCATVVPAERRVDLEATGAIDFAFTRPGLGRFRCNVHRERGHWAGSIRLFPPSIPTLAELNLPESLSRFSEIDHGLVLITGPTGSGKSTTIASLVRRILERRRVHVVTIEDPVEYEHGHADSVVEHIEIGRDVDSYPHALRAALRQDPDVIVIGEMRDPESISIAITAAETGHLVLSTLHTGDGPQTIHRVLDSYPANQIETVRVQLSISLAGIVSQTLLPRIDGNGRIPAVEVLMATNAVRNLIRQGKIELIRSQITLERNQGMLGLDRSLARLVASGEVDEAEARTRVRVPGEFEMLLRSERGPD